MSVRAEKVASLVKRIIAELMRDYAQEYKAGLVTVTSVKISDDLQNARVYISVYGGQISSGEFISKLEVRIGEIRSHVGANIKLRYTPEIKFYLDDTLDQIDHIQKLLDSVKSQDSNL